MFNFIIGLLIVIAGALVTLKSEWFYRNFGPIPSFEKYLGSEGGSRLGYQIIGILITMIGFMVMFNLINSFLSATVGQLFGGRVLSTK